MDGESRNVTHRNTNVNSAVVYYESIKRELKTNIRKPVTVSTFFLFSNFRFHTAKGALKLRNARGESRGRRCSAEQGDEKGDGICSIEPVDLPCFPKFDVHPVMCTRRQHTRCCCVVLCLVLFGLIEGWHITCNSGCCVPHDKHLKFIGSADMWATNDEDNACQRALEHVEGSLKEIPPTILVRKIAAESEARVNKVLCPRINSGAVALSCRLSLRGGVSTRRSNGTAATQQARYVRDSGDGLSGQEKRGLSSRMQDMDAHHSLPLSAVTQTLAEVQRWNRKGNTAISSTKQKSEEHEDDDDSEEDEDDEFEDEDLEGPRHPRASTKQSREKRTAKMLDRIAQKAHMNSTYMKGAQFCLLY